MLDSIYHMTLKFKSKFKLKTLALCHIYETLLKAPFHFCKSLVFYRCRLHGGGDVML